jgi:hypothetical protein
MKQLVIAATAASLFAFGAAVNAEQTLTAAEMDGVTAAGFVDTFADARARGVEAETVVFTDADVRTIDEIGVPGQKGRIEVVRSRGVASSYAYAAPGSIVEADGYAIGDTEGTLASDILLRSYADADTTGALVAGSKYSAYSQNRGEAYASEIVRGRTASSNVSAASVVFLGNYGNGME